jgi:hypothetical protein
MDSKSIFASKTLWLNLLGPVFTLLAAHGLALTPDQQLAAIGIVMAGANIVVRLFTSQPVHIVTPPAVALLALSLGGALALGGCAQLGLTGNPTADAPKLFQDACLGLTTADGMFQSASPSLIAAGKLDPGQLAQEKAIFAVASNQCAHPPVDAGGAVNYAALAMSITADAGAIYLILSPPLAGSAAASAIAH